MGPQLCSASFMLQARYDLTWRPGLHLWGMQTTPTAAPAWRQQWDKGRCCMVVSSAGELPGAACASSMQWQTVVGVNCWSTVQDPACWRLQITLITLGQHATLNGPTKQDHTRSKRRASAGQRLPESHVLHVHLCQHRSLTGIRTTYALYHAGSPIPRIPLRDRGSVTTEQQKDQHVSTSTSSRSSRALGTPL